MSKTYEGISREQAERRLAEHARGDGWCTATELVALKTIVANGQRIKALEDALRMMCKYGDTLLTYEDCGGWLPSALTKARKLLPPEQPKGGVK